MHLYFDLARFYHLTTNILLHRMKLLLHNLIKYFIKVVWKKTNTNLASCCRISVMLQLSHVGFKTENWGITWPLIAQFRSAQSGEQSPLSSSSAHRSARKGRAGQVSAAGSGSQLCAERQGKLPIRQSVLLGFFQSLEWLCHISWLWAMSHY